MSYAQNFIYPVLNTLSFPVHCLISPHHLFALIMKRHALMCAFWKNGLKNVDSEKVEAVREE